MEQGPCEAVDGTLGSAKVASLGKAWDHFSHYRVSDVETSWDVEPFAAGLQCLHLDTPLLEQLNINTKKLDETKNCVHVQLEQMLDPKRQKKKKQKKPNCHFWEAWSKSKGWGAKAECCTCPPHSRHLRSNKPPKPLLGSKPWMQPYPHPT